MAKKIIAMLQIVTALSLLGCATYYKEVSTAQPHATISGKSGSSLLAPPKAHILEINGMPLSNMWKGYAAKRKIPTGKNSIYASSNLPGALTASGPIEFVALSNKHYYVTSEPNVETISLMVVDSGTNEVVAAIEAPKVRKPPPAQTSFIPIYIPTN